MRLVPLGVRGSTPTPGAEFVRYGGHTSSVAVYAAGAAAPELILDAGSGLSTLPGLLGGEAFTGRIVLSHLHWDHVQGLPFCRAIDRDDAMVTLHIPVDSSESDSDAYALLARGFSPPHFPITPGGLHGSWKFVAMHPGHVATGVTAMPIAHKGGTAFALRIELDGAVLAYLPDHALHSRTELTDCRVAAHFVSGADILVHDSQFTASETDVAAAYGHATIETVLDLADEAEVGSVVLTHHSPTRTDDALDELAARFTTTPDGRSVQFARQGVPIDVPA